LKSPGFRGRLGSRLPQPVRGYYADKQEEA